MSVSRGRQFLIDTFFFLGKWDCQNRHTEKNDRRHFLKKSVRFIQSDQRISSGGFLGIF